MKRLDVKNHYPHVNKMHRMNILFEKKEIQLLELIDPMSSRNWLIRRAVKEFILKHMEEKNYEKENRTDAIIS